MQTFTFRLPAHWASALINGDFSGYYDGEESQIDRWLDDHADALGPCLDMEEAGFSWSQHDASYLGVLPAAVARFTFPAKIGE